MGVATAALGFTGIGLTATSAHAEDGPPAPAANSSNTSGNGSDKVDWPSKDAPGPDLDPDSYQMLAQMPNDSFNTVRDAVRDPNFKDDFKDNPELQKKAQELQRGFASDGCSVPGTVQLLVPVTAGDTKACTQHDFRYVVGPHVYGDDLSQPGTKAEKTDADAQLGRNVADNNKLTSWFPDARGKYYEWGTWLFGDSHYKNTY
ncbi:DUF1353 domain-containing protein [Streptomyces sp. CG1]|uniref:DUF1353 domain-containing protein n=1 Tax=Streptomyces sp. CG1 TaxID=1287523 RepID=UPI0034E2BE54